MCSPKSKGGLGFRNLHGFNIALLGKQVWNFIQKPNALVTRIFKARYFGNCNILQARKGADSSFVWTGLWEAKEQLVNGFRWVLGDGMDIKVFQDPWLRGKNDFRIEDHHLNNVRNEKVCDYFRPNTKEWDVHKVEHSFHTDDIRLILQTRIPQNHVKDRLAWVHSNNGQCTVKSAYHYWFERNYNMPDDSYLRGWKKLWNLNIPHKVKTFLWRFCKNTVPVRNRLRSKGIDLPISCPVCEADVEHLLHVFFDCRFASQCWQRVGFVEDMMQEEYAPNWLLKKLCTETDSNIIKIATVLWGVWFARNKKVWENSTLTPALSMEISSKQISEWQEAMTKKKRRVQVGTTVNSNAVVSWEAPGPGWLKLNVDASVQAGANFFANGMVLRDEFGSFVQGRNLRTQGGVSVMEAEAFGVLEALKWIEENDYHRVIIESDSLLVVEAIQKGSNYHLEVGSLLEACREKINRRSDIIVCHVKKQANKVAHMLAKYPCLLDSYNVFMSPPEMLLETLLSDCLVI